MVDLVERCDWTSLLFSYRHTECIFSQCLSLYLVSSGQVREQTGFLSLEADILMKDSIKM